MKFCHRKIKFRLLAISFFSLFWLSHAVAQILHSEVYFSPQTNWHLSTDFAVRYTVQSSSLFSGALDTSVSWRGTNTLMSINLGTDLGYLNDIAYRQLLTADLRLNHGINQTLGVEVFVQDYTDLVGSIPLLLLTGGGPFLQTTNLTQIYVRFGVNYFIGMLSDFTKSAALHGLAPYGITTWMPTKSTTLNLACYFQAAFPGPLLVNTAFQASLRIKVAKYLDVVLSDSLEIPITKGKIKQDLRVGAGFDI